MKSSQQHKELRRSSSSSPTGIGLDVEPQQDQCVSNTLGTVPGHPALCNTRISRPSALPPIHTAISKCTPAQSISHQEKAGFVMQLFVWSVEKHQHQTADQTHGPSSTMQPRQTSAGDLRLHRADTKGTDLLLAVPQCCTAGPAPSALHSAAAERC